MPTSKKRTTRKPGPCVLKHDDGFIITLSPKVEGSREMDIQVFGEVTAFDLLELLDRAKELIESGEFKVDGSAT